MVSPPSNADYRRWMPRAEATGDELAAMQRQASGLAYLPRISVLLLVSDADEVWIKNSVNSVLGQIYPRLELCVCDNGSERPHVPEVLAEYAAADERVRVRRLPGKGSRAAACGAALSGAAGEFVVLLDQGDELAPEALFKIVELLQRVRADVVYADEDRIDVVGERTDPEFKPYWSPELLMSTPYVGRPCLMRRSLVEAAGGFREGFEGAEEQDLLLRLSEATDRAYHLPGVLYHRWVPLLPAENGAAGGARGGASSRAVEEALARRGEDAEVEPDPAGGSLRVGRRPAGGPTVSVILSASGEEVDAPFLEELKASYPVEELIVAGGEGDAYPNAERVSHPSPAQAMNLAAGMAGGEFLVFTGGCVRAETPGWLSEMLGHARRPDVGAVGCRLLKPNGVLRHGGTFADLGRLTGHSYGRIPKERDRALVADHAFDLGAASAGCMVVRRGVFEEAGGFDDENLPTAFYDLDLSFRLRETGLRNVYTPYATLVRGGTAQGPPGENEVAYMWKRWWGELVRLLYYERSPLLRAPHRNKTAEEALLAAISS